MAATVRRANWDGERDRIERIDTSYSADRVYRVRANGLGFSLDEERVDPPITRRHGVEMLAESDAMFVAEDDGDVVGVAGVQISGWNRRAVVTGLYVSPEHRGRGVGSALVAALTEHARDARAHCLWLETQAANLPAVGFYRHVGFRLCGLDDRFYDPDANPDDVALFFALDL